MAQIWILVGSVSAFLSVAFGAFGAHGLAEKLEPRMLQVFNTGAQYQMYHALALIGFGLWSSQHSGVSGLPGWAFALGSILFSGSLYLLALTGVRVLGAITPIGGVLFLLGWLAFGYGVWQTY